MVVRGTEAPSAAATKRAIDAEQARQIAKLAHRVEEALGGPEDIEWALAAGFSVPVAGPADNRVAAAAAAGAA